MAGLILASGSPAGATAYVFQAIAPPSAPPNAFVAALALNDHGQVLVSAYLPNVSYDFTVVDDVYNVATKSYAPIPAVPGADPNSTRAEGINDAGQIVGGYHPPGAGFESFLYSGGAFSTVNPGGGFVNEANSISNNGKIVGYQGASGAVEGYLLSGGLITPIAAAPFPANSTLATGVNDAGVVVGDYGPPSAATAFSFVDNGGVITTLSMSGEASTNASGINDLGEIVGGVSNDGYATGSGFVYRNGAFAAINAPGAVLTFVEGVNDKGQLVGYDFTADGAEHLFLASPAPEPAAWALMLTGLGLAGATLRRRKVIDAA